MATTVPPLYVARADGASIHYLCRGQNGNFCAIGAERSLYAKKRSIIVSRQHSVNL